MLNKNQIDEIALSLIDDNVGSPWEYNEQDKDLDHTRLLMLGYIRGILDLRSELRKEIEKQEKQENALSVG